MGITKISQTKNFLSKKCKWNISSFKFWKKKQPVKIHISYNHRFQKIFKESNIVLAVQNIFNMKILIEANKKEKVPNNTEFGILYKMSGL